MAEYRLYCFAESGHAYKAALMLNLCKADWEPKFVDYFNGETRTPAYRATVNEMGEAPVLEHRTQRITQSGVILDYLAERFGRFGWNNDAERREILRWTLFDNHKLTSYTATYRFLVFLTKGDPAVAEFLRGRMTTAMGIVNARLADHAFITGAKPTIADISMCGYLFFGDEFGVDFSKEYPNMARWLDRIRALPGWAHPYDLMPRKPSAG
jgi:glutathione S-transferase